MYEHASFLGQVSLVGLGQFSRPCDTLERFMKDVAQSITYANRSAQQALARGDNNGAGSWADHANELSKEWEKWKKKYDECLRAQPVPTITPVTPEPYRPGGGYSYPVTYPEVPLFQPPPPPRPPVVTPSRPFSPSNIPQGAYNPVPSFDPSREEGMAPTQPSTYEQATVSQDWRTFGCRPGTQRIVPGGACVPAGLVSSALTMPTTTVPFTMSGRIPISYGLGRRRPLMGQVTMSLDERNEILDRIKIYVGKMDEINQFTQTVPDWAQVDPFQKAQPQFDKALDRAYEASDQLRGIGMRLEAEGPWTKLNDAEQAAFLTWQGAIDEMYAIYQAAKPDGSFDVRAAAAAGVVGILFTIAIMGA